jgi:hypothetical protein
MPHRDPRVKLDDSPKARTDLVTLQVGAESVVLDGWRAASVLNPSATEVWRRLDGSTTLAAVADDIAEALRVDRDSIASDILILIRDLGLIGLLDGADLDATPGAPPIILEPAHVVTDIGETIEGLEFGEMNKRAAGVSASSTEACLLINWSPHCGYCASIIDELADLDAALKTANVSLVLYAYGSADASDTQARLSGWHPRVILKPPHEIGPFVGHGTPAAFHLDAHGNLLSPAARGTDEVIELASALAGREPQQQEPAVGGAHYLLERGGSCAPSSGSEPITRWAGTRVYRIGRYHVGLRYTTEPTARLLDELFNNEVVQDPKAGHIYTVSLPTVDKPGDGSAAAGARHHLLTLGSQVLVRSRSHERVLRALLWRLGDHIGNVDIPPGVVRTNATAVLTPAGAALVQPGLYVLEEQLQPAFARHNIAFVDVVNPQIDLQTAELVVPEPSVPHNGHVLESPYGAPLPSWDESDPVRPGRYPLIGWGVIHPVDEAVTRFSPAQSAAATLSFVLDTDDPAARVGELGDLFQRIDGFGLSYHSESELADALAQALNLK